MKNGPELVCYILLSSEKHHLKKRRSEFVNMGFWNQLQWLEVSRLFLVFSVLIHVASTLELNIACKFLTMTSLPEEIHSLKTLRILKIYCCTALATLPHFIGSLTSLEVLDLICYHQLASLPKEMRSLKNLQMLYISHCPHLEERCRKETGEDWPKISHIPDIVVR